MSATQGVDASVQRRYGASAARAGGRGVVRAWRVVLPVVLLGAVAQAVLVLPDPVPGQSPWVWALAAVSLVVIVASGALLAAAALESVRPVPEASVGWHPVLARVRRSAAGFTLWFLAWLVVVSIGLAWWTWPGLLVVAITPYLLLAASDGRRNALSVNVAAVRARPGRWLVTTVVFAVVAGLAWLSAAVSGFFLGGPVSAGLTWFWLGLLGAWFLSTWAAVYRSTPAGTRED